MNLGEFQRNKVENPKDIAKEWMEDFNPKCVICDPNKEQETTYIYDGMISLGNGPIGRFVCQDCGFISLVDLFAYSKNKFLNKF